MAYAQIDWHDFVVVETVDYQPNEVGMFPAPTTPDEVGARVLMQERIDQETDETSKNAKEAKQASEKQDINDVEMELSDKEDEPEVGLFVLLTHGNASFLTLPSRWIVLAFRNVILFMSSTQL